MKKILFLLVAVLISGMFVACDGESDFLLWEEDPVETRTLTLRIDGDDWSFEEDENVFVKAFSDYDFSSVTTWQQLIDRGFEIVIYDVSGYYDGPHALQLSDFTECVGFEFSDASLLLEVWEGDRRVSLTDPIDFSVQYDLLRVH